MGDEKEKLTLDQRIRIQNYAKNRLEYAFKELAYLTTAHGAGLLACLAAIRDYNNIPQMRGIGLFVVLFSTGLIAACIATSTLNASAENMYLYIAGQEESTKTIDRYGVIQGVLGAISAILFVAAVGIAGYRFSGL